MGFWNLSASLLPFFLWLPSQQTPFEFEIPERLPQNLELNEKEAQQYKVTCEYFQTDVRDRFLGKDRISALYSQAAKGGPSVWRQVVCARQKSLEEDYGEGKPVEYMEGFDYDLKARWMMFFPGFFRGFPSGSATASYGKNLVWDLHMVEDFSRGFFDRLELNRPLAPTQMSDSGVPLGGLGMFKNRKVELTWIGVSERNDEPCALIRYQAFFNRFEMSFGGSKTVGLSHYWGEIWVSLEDKQVEYATLYEQVSMRMGSSEDKMTPYRVFRVGSIEKI